MTVKEFIKNIESGKAKVLTLKRAKRLKGKRILWFFFGYRGNENVVSEMEVGDIISELDFSKTDTSCPGYANRSEYWLSHFSEKQIEYWKETLLLLNSEGKNVYIKCHPKIIYEKIYEEPTFTCSDADREVYFMEL